MKKSRVFAATLALFIMNAVAQNNNLPEIPATVFPEKCDNLVKGMIKISPKMNDAIQRAKSMVSNYARMSDGSLAEDYPGLDQYSPDSRNKYVSFETANVSKTNPSRAISFAYFVSSKDADSCNNIAIEFYHRNFYPSNKNWVAVKSIISIDSVNISESMFGEAVLSNQCYMETSASGALDKKVCDPNPVTITCYGSDCVAKSIQDTFESPYSKHINSNDPWPKSIKVKIAEMEKFRAQILAEKTKQADLEAAKKRAAETAAAAEAARIQRSEIEALNNALSLKDPQRMYLSAGKYERDGNISNAKIIYEKIIDKFPDSQYALKANDQLNTLKRADDTENSARQRVYDESNRCSARIKSCESSCFSLEGSSYGSCLRRCQSICSR